MKVDVMHNFLARAIYLLKGPYKTNAFPSGRTLKNETVKVDEKMEGCFPWYGRFTNIFKLSCTTIFLLEEPFRNFLLPNALQEC